MPTFEIKHLCWAGLGPVDLDIGAGECLCLSGPSGSGKTLLLRALVDLDEHLGLVSLDGVSQDAVPAPTWRKRVGYLPAESQWWYDTVRPHYHCETDAVLLQALGFEMDVLDWTVARLSTGEKQRLALARLLACKPSVLLLDEPTASLDGVNVQRVEKLIKEYQDGVFPVIWVSHDAEQIRRIASRHFRIQDRTLTEAPL